MSMAPNEGGSPTASSVPPQPADLKDALLESSIASHLRSSGHPTNFALGNPGGQTHKAPGGCRVGLPPSPTANLTVRVARGQCVHVAGFGWFFEAETEDKRFA